MTTLKFTHDKGHLMLPLGDRMALVDTGSPQSISSLPFDFGGDHHTPPNQMMGMTTEELSELAGIKIDILIGCDILSLYKTRIRWNESCIDIGDDTPDGDTADHMETMMGCPVFPLRIGSHTTNAIFDTGAHLSYITPSLVAGVLQIGEKEDFHPINGHFRAPTYNVETTLGDKTFLMEYGTLSGILGMSTEMAMEMTNSSAVIGTQLLEHFDCTLSWKERIISWRTSIS